MLLCDCEPLEEFYLHDDELQHKGKLADVSWWQVKHDRSAQNGARPSPALSAANHHALVVQIHQQIVICRQEHHTNRIKIHRKDKMFCIKFSVLRFSIIIIILK